MSDVHTALRDTAFGQMLSANEIAELAQAARLRKIKAGESLFRANESGDALYLVLLGNLDVCLADTDVAVAHIGAGQIVGELEVMTQARRVAGLLAREDVEVLEIAADTFHAMLEKNSPAATKLVVNIAKTLARRLAAVNQRILEKSHKAAEQPSPPPAAAPAAKPVPEVEGLEDEDLQVLDQLWS